MSVSVLGVRHHGPGSARAVASFLERLRPDVILVEGPPEADSLVSLVPVLEPPVALLAHVPGDPSRAAFWPFAEFSPEWQALLYGTRLGVPVRFCDLPAAHSLAFEGSDRALLRTDPIGTLAHAAGYDDPERWWEDAVEHRGDTPFEVIASAMSAVREGYAASGREAQREAHMRKVLRTCLQEGFSRIAVVCGAWHVPALTTLPSAQSDAALLRGMAKVKVELTWIPWTYGRLASWSGYGAGITSPGWYHHLFTVPDQPVERWLAAAAGVLRSEGLAVSSAHVIEAVRLAQTLATLRGRPLAGLGEVTDAARAVLCEGDELPLALIQRRMVVGDRLGSVGEGTPMVPLQCDLRDAQRRLRLRPEPQERLLDLDLRKPLDLARSHLLHRLRLLDVSWGVLGESWGLGTFRETWTLAWHPEHDLRLIEHAALGTTLKAAATHYTQTLATGTTPPPAPGGAAPPGPRLALPPGRGGALPPGPRRALPPGSRSGVSLASGGGVSLAELTGLVERCLLADLPDALPSVLAAMSARAAADTDVTHLMAALPSLVRAHRYGDVRGTSADGLGAVVLSMLDRICAGLPAATGSLDDAAATQLLTHIDATHTAIALLGAGGAAHPDAAGAASLAGSSAVLAADTVRGRWVGALRVVCGRAGVHGRVEGRVTRLLLDAGELDDVEDRMARATSRGHPPARVAAWVEGFLGGGGLLLVHDPGLLGLVDRWLSGLSAEQFVEVLPLLRRTFATFAAPERRAIGQQVRSGRHEAVNGEVDERRAAPAVHTVLTIFGG